MAFDAVTAALKFAVLSTKHVGFNEEREWRVIYRPFEFASAAVVEKVVAIRSTPQLVYQLPLASPPGMNIPGSA